MCNKILMLNMTGQRLSDEVRLETGWKDRREESQSLDEYDPRPFWVFFSLDREMYAVFDWEGNRPRQVLRMTGKVPMRKAKCSP
jgi:hypothetical protein